MGRKLLFYGFSIRYASYFWNCACNTRQLWDMVPNIGHKHEAWWSMCGSQSRDLSDGSQGWWMILKFAANTSNCKPLVMVHLSNPTYLEENAKFELKLSGNKARFCLKFLSFSFCATTDFLMDSFAFLVGSWNARIVIIAVQLLFLIHFFQWWQQRNWEMQRRRYICFYILSFVFCSFSFSLSIILSFNSIGSGWRPFSLEEVLVFMASTSQCEQRVELISSLLWHWHALFKNLSSVPF